MLKLILYDNHLETFSEFGFTEIDLKSVDDFGCTNKSKKDKDGSTVLYTLIKKV